MSNWFIPDVHKFMTPRLVDMMVAVFIMVAGSGNAKKRYVH